MKKVLITELPPQDCVSVLREELHRRRWRLGEPFAWGPIGTSRFRVYIRERRYGFPRTACTVFVRLEARPKGGTEAHCRFCIGEFPPYLLLTLFVLIFGLLAEAGGAVAALVIVLLLLAAVLIPDVIWNGQKAPELEKRLCSFLLDTWDAKEKGEDD